jgi:hypothetical protein
MKIAVCLSGHTRNYKQNHPNFNFDADTFIHTAWQSGLPSNNTPAFISYHSQDYVDTSRINDEELSTLYSPKMFTIIDDNVLRKPLERYKHFKTVHNGKLDQIGTMFYNIYFANGLKQQYEQSQGFKYDFVIRSRFDIKINSMSFDSSNVYMAKREGVVSDLFFAGSSDIIDRLSNCYEWFIEQDPYALAKYNNAEHILTTYINSLNLNIPISSDFDIVFNKDYPIQTLNIKNGEYIFAYNH